MKNCRAHHDQWLQREGDLDQWIRSIPRSRVSHSIKGGRVGGMLRLLGVDGPDEGNLEIDGGGPFSQIKLHILVVWKLRHKDLAYQRLGLQRERIYGVDCIKKHRYYAA